MTTHERSEPIAAALQRIIMVADLIPVDPALEEAISMGRVALRLRDAEYTSVTIVVGDRAEAGAWMGKHLVEAKNCTTIGDADDLDMYVPPYTVVLLPGAHDRDDYPILAAKLATLADRVDVIRITEASNGA